ncbi:hypothetical protein D3C86_1318230 [compost metagenome]
MILRASQGSVAVMKLVEVGVNSSVMAGARNERLRLPRTSRSLNGRQRRPVDQDSSLPDVELSTER